MARMASDNVPVFRPLTGIYEPSAVQQLADGHFLVVEDEKQHPFSLVTVGADGSIGSTALDLADDALRKLNDLEGLTLGHSGCIYAITSHSRDGDGEARKSRDKLVRFRIEDRTVLAPVVVDSLKAALIAAHPVLAAAAEIPDVKAEGGLNIEALEITPDQRQLLIGFRSPLLGQRAIVAAVENPAAIFDAGEPPRIGTTLEKLDLGGHGVRGMAYIPSLDGYLVISGPASREQAQFRLWFWSGGRGDPARRVTVLGLKDLERAEGVCAAFLDGQQRILIVSDDGSREEGRCAGFLLLDAGQLILS